MPTSRIGNNVALLGKEVNRALFHSRSRRRDQILERLDVKHCLKHTEGLASGIVDPNVNLDRVHASRIIILDGANIAPLAPRHVPPLLAGLHKVGRLVVVSYVEAMFLSEEHLDESRRPP